MTARWAATTAYSAGDLVLPTTDNGHTYYCAAAGTSGGTEPTWPSRFANQNSHGGIVDGTVEWVPYTVVTPVTLQALMGWDTSTGGQQPNHAEWVLGNYLLDAASSLEKSTNRHLLDAPGLAKTWTSMLRATLPIPGLRTATTVTYAGNALDASGYWLLPDALQTGVYTGIQFRAWRTGQGPWYLADPLWFDKALDSPWNPANYGGGYVFSSLPNDTSITGDWGYAPGAEPPAFVHALEVLAGWMAMRPTAILADSVITPQGGVVSYSQMPAEVAQFVRDWSVTPVAVSVG